MHRSFSSFAPCLFSCCRQRMEVLWVYCGKWFLYCGLNGLKPSLNGCLTPSCYYGDSAPRWRAPWDCPYGAHAHMWTSLPGVTEGGRSHLPPTEQPRPPSLLVEGVRMASKKRGTPAQGMGMCCYASPSCLRIRLIRSRSMRRSSSPISSWLKRWVASRRIVRKTSSRSTLVMLKGLPPLGRGVERA